MGEGGSSSSFRGSDLDSLCHSAEARARWPFLRDLRVESTDRAQALTHARTDIAGWLHVPEQLRAFTLLVERLLRPGEKLMGIPELDFKAPLSSQAHLIAQRERRATPIPQEAASRALFETTFDEGISVLAIPALTHPLPPEYSTSGSYVAGPSVRKFKWGLSSQTLLPTPEPLLPYLQTQGDLVDAAYVLIANAAFRAPFAHLPALLFILSVRDFELPDPDILVEGGRIDSIVNLEASRFTRKGFMTHEVRSSFFDQNGHKDASATFTFAATDDQELARSFRNPRLK